jgi:hypothetical protein
MEQHLAPIIVVVFLWRADGALPPYFADSAPDVCALLATPGITGAVSRTAYLVYE